MIPNYTKKLILVIIVSTIISCSHTDPEFDADGDIAKGKIKLISYGLSLPLPPPYTDYNKQVDSLQKVYGIEFEERGCMTDSLTLVKMNNYNKIIISYLSKRNGDNWFQRYQRQVDSLYKLVNNIQDTIKRKNSR